MTKVLTTNNLRSRPVDRVLAVSALSSTIGVIVTQPLDVLKTRLQAPPILKSDSSVGIRKTFKSLWNGVSAQDHSVNRIRIFWSGTIPSLWRAVPGVCAYFTALNLLQPYMPRTGSSAINSFTLGFISRCIVGTVFLPFTVVKAHAEAGLHQNQSTFVALQGIYRTAKLKGLYSGLLPTLARDSPYSGIYLLFYNQFKNVLIPDERSQASIPSYMLSICAFSAAICATAVTQPADVLRSNRQLSIISATPKVPWTRVVRETVKIDGITGLWRGFYLRLIRRSIFAVITWTLFDKIPTSTMKTC